MSKRFLDHAFILAMAVVPFAPSLKPAPVVAAEQTPAVREIEIVVEGGYKPARITVAEGEPVRLKFIRKEWNGCTREVLIPAIALRRELPPNKPVFIDWPALAPGDYEFRCGMNMIRGIITVVPR